ncbi:MAG: hypothetical protein ACKPEA_10290, partial [Planctomycetota bacterium]
STVELSALSVTGRANPLDGIAYGRGLSIEGGSSLRLRDSKLTRGGEVALFVDATSELVGERLWLEDNANTIVALGGGVTLTDTAVRIPIVADTPDGESSNS